VYTHSHTRTHTACLVYLFVMTFTRSAALKRGLLHEAVEQHFTFVDVRMSQVASELEKLLKAHKFMDMEPVPDENFKKSTYHRWQAQVSLKSQCTLFRQINEHVIVVHEHVPKDHHMTEDIIRVHVVNIEGFLWEDSEQNVVPTCCCPANRNMKDCCAGIMFALELQKDRFKQWGFKSSFLEKKELLSRRLRADLDPVRVCFDFHITF
jgi:hypothetical protein